MGDVAESGDAAVLAKRKQVETQQIINPKEFKRVHSQAYHATLQKTGDKVLARDAVRLASKRFRKQHR